MEKPEPARRATNLSIDSALLQEARALQVNLSRAAENGIAEATAKAKAEVWKRENRAAVESSNDYVRENGLPLAKVRQC